jgi:hypothetical protein
MQECSVQKHEAEHLDDMRHLDEDERRVLYRLAHRWRLEHDAELRNLVRISPLRIVKTGTA